MRVKTARLGGVLAASVLCLWGCEDPGLRRVPGAGLQVDTFQQTAAGKIDVLWVVDNSPTMARQRENVARNIERFFASVGPSTDFHVAITTTDVRNDNGRLVGDPPLITASTPDPLAAFARNVQVGTQGAALEQGLEAARRTFELHNRNFIREDAHLFLVFVSDEDDQSAPGTAKYFYRFFKGLKGKGNESMVSAGAIVGDVPDGCSSEAGLGRAGDRYTEFVEMMGGRAGSICDPEFDRTLRDLGMDAVGLQRKFQLSKTPELEQMVVRIRYPCSYTDEVLGGFCSAVDRRCESFAQGTATCTAAWKSGTVVDGVTYELATNSLVFHGGAVPPKGAVVEATYPPVKK